jgi:hypothetical protein
MKRISTAAAIALSFFVLTPSAEAKRHHYRSVPEQPQSTMFWQGFGELNAKAARIGKVMRYSVTHALGPKPRAWCGWFMRSETGITDPSLNLARNWARVGSDAGGPRVGAIVVWHNHVGKIVGGAPGAWVVRSGNDSHAVRERVRSLAGAIAFRSV